MAANETFKNPLTGVITKTITNAPPTKPGAKCYKQPVPDLNSLGVGPPSPAVLP